MSPAPFVSSQYDHVPHSQDCVCDPCAEARFRVRNPHLYGYREKPGHSIPLRVLITTIIIGGALWAGGIYLAANAWAREGAIKPVKAPESLLRARAVCPLDQPLKCRAALRRAYQSITWQKQARNKAHAYTSRDVVLDAIQWASEKYHVPAWQMRSVGTCESHLFWLAQNGQYLSWAQLSLRHRSDPVIARLTWRDPYAVADHVARYVKRYGWSEWQCTPGGGLRW